MIKNLLGEVFDDLFGVVVVAAFQLAAESSPMPPDRCEVCFNRPSDKHDRIGWRNG